MLAGLVAARSVPVRMILSRNILTTNLVTIYHIKGNAFRRIVCFTIKTIVKTRKWKKDTVRTLSAQSNCANIALYRIEITANRIASIILLTE